MAPAYCADRQTKMVECAHYSALCVLRAQCDLLSPINPMPAVQSYFQKYFRSRLPQINPISIAIPSPQRGVSRSSRTLGMGCGGRGGIRHAKACSTNDARRGRRSRVVLTPRRWRQVSREIFPRGDGDKKARSPGRARRKPLKPLRREGRVIPVHLWFRTRVLSTFAHEAVGAAGTRLSLRPLFSLGERFHASLGRLAPRGCGGVSSWLLELNRECKTRPRHTLNCHRPA
jgi:hypothetical protein